MAKVMQENEAKNAFSFKEMKAYSEYLLNNRLEELAVESLRMQQAHGLSLLKLFNHLSEEELLALTRQSLRDFFADVKNDRALANAIFSIIRWRDDELPGIPRTAVEGADLVLTYSIRKQLFLKFLPDYTSDCHQVVAIMQELEQFYMELEQRAFEVFIEIQKEELSEKNDFLSSLVRNSEDAIMAFDLDLKITEWNPVAETLFGLNKETVLGHQLSDTNPLSQPEYLEALKFARQGKRMQMLRQYYKDCNGCYDASIMPLYNEQGNLRGVLSVLHDITEVVEQEETLREHQEELQASNEELQESLAQLEETEEILRAAVEQLEEAQAIAHLGNWEYDASRNLIFWSRELRRIFGMDDQDLNITYSTYLDLIYPDDREQVAAAIARCFENHEPYAIEHRILRKDGTIRWLLGQGKATAIGSGNKLLRLSGTAIDVTERKLAELKVQEEQHFIKKVTDTIPDVLTIFDLEKRVNIYGNRELYEVLGYSSEEVEEFRKTLGSQWVYSLLHPEDLPRFFAFIESLRSHKGKEALEIEYRGRNKSGQYLWVMGRYNIFKRNEQGQVVQIIGVTRNITHRKKAEQIIKDSEAQLRELNNKLEDQVASRTAELTRKNYQLTRINADLDNFIYTASHDLKAPIANLEGLLTLLDTKIKALLAERDQELLDMMHQSISRFKKTIKDLTDIAHMQKELEEETTEKVEFLPLIRDIQADISNLIQQTGASLSLNLEVEIMGYNLKNLRSVLHNLITNAIKYRKEDCAPEVTVSTSRLGDYVLLKVGDNGQGIPEKQQEKVFSLFKRLRKDIEGSGMGLYIVKRIIENSGGRIEVASEVGKGSVFTLYLKDQTVHER